MNKTKILIFVFTFAAGVLAFDEAKAATYYVDSARPDDFGSGASWANAKKTIAAGVALLASGDTLKVKSGNYNEPLLVANKQYLIETKIETDDGTGNPGVVNVSGATTQNSQVFRIAIVASKNVTIDGRQSEADRDTNTGFVVAGSSEVHHGAGIHTNNGSGGNCANNKLLRIKATGDWAAGSYEGIFSSQGCDNSEIAYNYMDSGDCAFCVQISNQSGYENYSGGLFHHNKIVSCNPSQGYAVYDNLRINGISVYNNFITGIPSNKVFFRNRDTEGISGTRNQFYNNIVRLVNSTIYTIFQSRGFTGGSGGSDNHYFFNNTIDLNGYTATIFFPNDDSDSNEVFNNLIIGNVASFVDNFGDSQGTGNKMYNNVVTGSVNVWFSGSTTGMFSVNSSNAVNQGVPFLNLSGSIPFPYFGMNTSKDGAGSESLVPAPVSIPFDFSGNSRFNPPDVGAFEYITDTTPPYAPRGLSVW